MKFGINLMIFGDTVDCDVLRRFGEVAEAGYDGVEVPLFDPAAVPVDSIRERAEEFGLHVTASGAPPAGASLCSKDAHSRRAAADHIRSAVRAAAALSSPVLCGPMYKPVGAAGGAGSLQEQRRRAATALKPLADEAHAMGVTIAVEPLNRFETDLVNTAAQGQDFVGAVDSPGVGLLLDTFHMHIEEKDSAAAVGQAAQAGVLAHFHASENDRGVPGTGQVDWEGVASALWVSGYEGWIVLETFNQRSRAIRRAASCWRPFYESEQQYMREGLAFVREVFGPR